MDARRFDTLARSLGSAANRRTTLGALLGGLISPLLPNAAAGARDRGKDRGRGKSKDKGKGKERRRDKRRGNGGGQRVQVETACYPGSPCFPGPGKNLGKCDFADSRR